MARGLQTWSKTAATNSSADSGVNWAEGMAPSAVNDSARAEMASAAMWRDDNNGSLSGTLSTATYSVTSNQVAGALTAGYTVALQLGSDMPATALLNLDTLGAKPLRPVAGTDFAGGEYKANQVIRATYFTSNSGEWIVTGAHSNLNIPIHNQTAESAQNVADEIPVYSATDTANRKVTVTNLLANVNGLTEDTSPDSAADFVLSYDTSATAAKKIKLSNVPSNLPRGHIDGCVLSNGTDATNDINITAGKCRDSTDAVDIVVSANTSGKQLDANWAVSGTTNSGMRNSAVGIANGTYHIYAARTAASSAATIYAFAGVAGTNPDSSAAITTVLTALQAESGGSSYVYARRIGSVIRESAAIVAFVQDGDYFTRTGTISSATVGPLAIPDSSGHLITLAVPLGLRVRSLVASETTSAVFLLLTDPSVTDQAAAAGTANSGLSGANQTEVWTNTSAQIRYRASSATGSLNLETYGWMDQRGKNA